MAGKFTEQEWELWKKGGWKENQKKSAEQWFDVDIPRYTYEGKRCPNEIGWREIPEIALKWYKVPWTDPEKALKAYNKGWKDPKDAHHYYYVIKSKSKDQRDEEAIMQLYENNLGRREVTEWLEKGFYDYKVISQLRKHGFDAENASRWLYALKKKGKLKKSKNKIDYANEIIKEASKWTHQGITYEGAKRYMKYGISPEIAGEWVKYFLVAHEWELDIVKKLIDLGLTAKDAYEWNKCIKPRSLTFLPSSISNWRNAGFENVEDAKSWKMGGFTSEEAKEWKSHGWTARKAKQAINEGKKPIDK